MSSVSRSVQPGGVKKYGKIGALDDGPEPFAVLASEVPRSENSIPRTSAVSQDDGRDVPEFVPSRREVRLMAYSLVEALREIGMDVDNVYDLVDTSARYEQGVPVLMEWLPKATGLNEQEGIARALTVPWASEAVPVLIASFEDAHAKGGELSWVYGNAIGVAWKPEHLDGILEIVEDRRFGTARAMIIYGLAKRKNARVADVIVDLLDDKSVRKQVLHYLLRRPDPRALGWLKDVAEGHADPVVASQAERALVKLRLSGLLCIT